MKRGTTGRREGAGSGSAGLLPAGAALDSTDRPTGVPCPRPGWLLGRRHIFLRRRNFKLLSGEWGRSPNLRQKCGATGEGGGGGGPQPHAEPIPSRGVWDGVQAPGTAEGRRAGWGPRAGGLDAGAPPTPRRRWPVLPLPRRGGAPLPPGPPRRQAFHPAPPAHTPAPGDPGSGSRSRPAPGRPQAPESWKPPPAGPQALRAAWRRWRRR